MMTVALFNVWNCPCGGVGGHTPIGAWGESDAADFGTVGHATAFELQAEEASDELLQGGAERLLAKQFCSSSLRFLRRFRKKRSILYGTVVKNALLYIRYVSLEGGN